VPFARFDLADDIFLKFLQRVLADKLLHVAVVVGVHLTNLQVVALPLLRGCFTKRGAACVKDKKIVTEADLPLRRFGSLAEIVLLTVARAEISFVEEADFADRGAANVHAEPDGGDEFGPCLHARFPNESIEGVRSKAPGKRVFLHEFRNAADRPIVGEGTGDSGQRIFVDGIGQSLIEAFRDESIAVEKQGVAIVSGRAMHADICRGDKPPVFPGLMDADLRVLSRKIA